LETPIPYDKFPTDLSFKDVYYILKGEADSKYERTQEYTFITKHTILGRWREIKLLMYSEYLKEFYSEQNNLKDTSF